MGHAQRLQRRILQALPTVGTADMGQNIGICARVNPGSAQCLQAPSHVNRFSRVGVDARSVIQPQRRIGLTVRRRQGNLTKRHTDIGKSTASRALNIYFSRSRECGTVDALGEIGAVNRLQRFGIRGQIDAICRVYGRVH